MPNREQRRHADKKALGKWLHVEDSHGNPYDIYLKDISGKDEFDFLQMTGGRAGGLCDIFFKGEPTLVGIAGLIWAVRRKYEKKLTVMEVLETVNMMTIETLEEHSPDEEDEEDVPVSRNGQEPPGFSQPTPPSTAVTSASSSPAYGPSTG